MKHIGSFSTGLSSAIACDRMLERYGCDNCEIVAMDTMVEDEDNWRFARDCESRWGKKIIVLQDGRTPTQVAEQAQIIPNQKIAPCTFALKVDVFMAWLDSLPVGDKTIHIGYDIFEAHRLDATKRNYNAAGYDVDFPLMWKPMEYRPYTQVVKDDWGIEPPRSYAMGFSHANCLKQLCFKVGQGDAIRFLINFPDRYKTQEDWEQMMRDHPTRKNYAILRDQSGGTVTPLTLKELRERHEANKLVNPSFFDKVSSGCTYCGVGDLFNQLTNRSSASEVRCA